MKAKIQVLRRCVDCKQTKPGTALGGSVDADADGHVHAGVADEKEDTLNGSLIEVQWSEYGGDFHFVSVGSARPKVSPYPSIAAIES